MARLRCSASGGRIDDNKTEELASVIWGTRNNPLMNGLFIFT
jgi:hypothetical protein